MGDGHHHHGGGDGHGCGCGHHDHHHHHDHDHPGHGGDQGGPPGTDFLDLELSQVLLGEANRMAQSVALDLMREALRERLRERLGDRLAAVGRIAADVLADDVEANLEIEARIVERKAGSADVEERLRAALAGKGPPPGPTRSTARTARRRKR